MKKSKDLQKFERLRDKLNLKTKTSYSDIKDIAYNTVSSRIEMGKIEATEVDGTVYIPLNQ